MSGVCLTLVPCPSPGAVIWDLMTSFQSGGGASESNLPRREKNSAKKIVNERWHFPAPVWCLIPEQPRPQHSGSANFRLLPTRPGITTEESGGWSLSFLCGYNSRKYSRPEKRRQVSAV